MKEVLYKNIDNKGVIIDVRDNGSYLMGHINGSKNIPYFELLNNYSKYLDKNKKYYLCCSHGVKSKNMATKLNSLGYDVSSIYGGYNYVKLMNNL